MNKFSKLLTSIGFTISLFSTILLAQDKTAKEADAEMEAAFGTIPMMMKAYPDEMRAVVWEWFKATQSPDGTIPSKYSELIALGVASQIPCSYCVYAHTTMAKMHGATDAELKAAIASAAGTRHWSTVLNGTDVSLEEFKEEWDGILEHIKNQSKKK